MLRRILASAAGVLVLVPVFASGADFTLNDKNTTVTFVGDPEKYTDPANERWEIQSTLDTLGTYMKRLGDRWYLDNRQQ